MTDEFKMELKYENTPKERYFLTSGDLTICVTNYVTQVHIDSISLINRIGSSVILPKVALKAMAELLLKIHKESGHLPPDKRKGVLK